MKVTNPKVKKLLEKYKEISLLNKISTTLAWDLNVNLPRKGADARARQIAYLTKIVTEKWTDPEFKKTLESLSGQSPTKQGPALQDKNSKLTQEEKAIVRNLERSAKFYQKVPKEIIVEFSETTSKAFMVWQEAKKNDKFKDFLPHLTKIVKLCQIVADHLGYRENPYDSLLDLYEPNLTASFCKKIFSRLQPELTKMLKEIGKNLPAGEAGKEVKGESKEENYPIDDQRQLSLFVLRKMGYDLEAGRMDVSSHPFTETLGRFDVRITNRYKTSDFTESLMVAMHEGGHALYEQGVSEEYENTPLDGGISLGIHESQSRFWENQIGRSYSFLKFMTPIFHAFYPNQLSKSGTEELFLLFNKVKPSLIRTEADEVTYNLHVALRFEIENGPINGKIKTKDLPEIWRDKMKKYLGIVPKTDREGVLQDVHWSYGSFGYFPTYTLGNLYAAQIATRLCQDFGGQAKIDEIVEHGELGTILSWLRSNIHQYGSLYYPDELSKKITGEILAPSYYLTYIKNKFSKIYSLK